MRSLAGAVGVHPLVEFFLPPEFRRRPVASVRRSFEQHDVLERVELAARLADLLLRHLLLVVPDPVPVLNLAEARSVEQRGVHLEPRFFHVSLRFPHLRYDHPVLLDGHGSDGEPLVRSFGADEYLVHLGAVLEHGVVLGGLGELSLGRGHVHLLLARWRLAALGLLVLRLFGLLGGLLGGFLGSLPLGGLGHAAGRWGGVEGGRGRAGELLGTRAGDARRKLRF
mmetsp:Transcript_11898/g.53930  ORF Transcript_11898/g.53930 Transcript_11898/m.53930 type:complete len:225 (-) Transcript_11898:145-819(-)